MLEMKYVGNNEKYDVNFKKITDAVVEIIGDFPIKTLGFILSRPGKEDDWNYSEYKTLFCKIEGGARFSNDESVCVEPPKSDLVPEPTPYVPTIEEIKNNRIAELNAEQQRVIHDGINVTLSDGSVEHFTLTANDQISLMGLQTLIASGIEQIPWHTSDQTEHCKYYSNTDMELIVNAAFQYVSYHVTYFRDLRIYINSLKDKTIVEKVVYGMPIPEEFQSDILKDMNAITEG